MGLAGRKIKEETRKNDTGINLKMMKKIVKGTSEP
jgi:hypothetical protein